VFQWKFSCLENGALSIECFQIGRIEIQKAMRLGD
jgi:hypothetical protein